MADDDIAHDAATAPAPAQAPSELRRSGIYAIRCLVGRRRVYVGSAVNLAKRWRIHRWHLERGSNPSRLLQTSWTKHGKDAFEFVVLECVADKSDLLKREQYWIDRLRAADNATGYNLRPDAGSQLGYKHTPEAIAAQIVRQSTPEYRAAIAAKLRGIPHTPERNAARSAVLKGRKLSASHIAARSAAQRGRHLSPEHRAKLIALHKGKKRSAEARANMSAAHRGKPLSPEHRAALSRVRKGKMPKTPLTPEARLKGIELKRGKPLSAAHREAIGRALRGRKRTPEEIAAMVAGRKRGREARRRVEL